MDDEAKPLVLYAFSHYDMLRGRWMKARYKATLEDIRARYPQHRIEGEPETRTGGGQFMPPGAKR